MSKTSYALIAVICAALLYMGAVRVREWQQARREAAEAAAMQDGEPFSFQKVPVSLAAPQADMLEEPVVYTPQYPAVYLEDTPLTPDTQREQAQGTVNSILADFNTELASFNQDVQAASGGEVQGLEDLSTQNLAQIVAQNPEISHVVEKHLKHPDFEKLIQEIFENPQFQESVKELQQTPASR